LGPGLGERFALVHLLQRACRGDESSEALRLVSFGLVRDKDSHKFPIMRSQSDLTTERSKPIPRCRRLYRFPLQSPGQLGIISVFETVVPVQSKYFIELATQATNPLLQTVLNRPPHLLRLRPRNPLLNIPILENAKTRHTPHPQLLRHILTFLDVVEEEFDVGVLGHHFGDFGCDGPALRAPGCCAFEDRDLGFVRLSGEGRRGEERALEWNWGMNGSRK
jgi:hypothetical protein